MFALVVVAALVLGGVAVAAQHSHGAATQVAPVDNPNNPNGFGSGTNFRLYPGDDENVAIENNRAAPEAPAETPEDAPAE